MKSSELPIDGSEVPNYNIITATKFRTIQEVKGMTDMRRVTIAIPDDLDKRILELKKDDRFVRGSYAEVVRQILERGLSVVNDRADDQGA